MTFEVLVTIVMIVGLAVTVASDAYGRRRTARARQDLEMLGRKRVGL